MFGEIPTPGRSRKPRGKALEWHEEVFLANGTFVVPPHVKEVFVDMCAGGGGGGGGSSGVVASGGGGQAGEFCFDYKVTVTPGEEVSITIGSGGAYVAGDNTGNDGGGSSFGGYISLDGGKGGKQAHDDTPDYHNTYGMGGGGDVVGSGESIRARAAGHKRGAETPRGSDGGGPIIKSGSLNTNDLICYGPTGGGGGNAGSIYHGYGGSNPFSGYESDRSIQSAGGGAGLFSPGVCGTTDADDNSGAGGGGGYSSTSGGDGGSGKCVVRWQK